MKKIAVFLLTTLLISSSLLTNTKPSYAHDKTSQQAYKEYYSLLYNLKEKNDIVCPIDSSGELDPEILNSYKGLLYADLIDFDNDNDLELFYIHTTGDGYYIYEVYGYENNKLIKLSSKKMQLYSILRASHETSLVVLNGITYIKDYEHEKGTFDYKEEHTITTFKNSNVITEKFNSSLTLTPEQEIYIVNGDDSLIEELSIYSHTVNDSENSISPDEYSSMLKKYESNQTMLIGNDSNAYWTDLDLNFENRNNLNKFIFTLFKNSYSTSFKDAHEFLSNNDYNKLDLLVSNLSHLKQFDINNFDESMMLEFVFNLYQTNEGKYADNLNILTQPQDKEINFKSSISIENLNKTLNEFFGISINFNSSDTFDFEHLKDTEHYNLSKFWVEDNHIIRDGNYYLDISEEYINRSINNIYLIKDDFYLLDITRDFFQIENNYYSIDLAIVKKLEDGNFNLIKLENKVLADEEILNYIGTLKLYDKSQSNNSISIPSSFIIIVPICITIILSCVGLLFIKVSNKDFSTLIVVSIILVSIIIGSISYIFLNKKYVSSSVDTINTITQDASNETTINSNKKDSAENVESIQGAKLVQEDKSIKENKSIEDDTTSIEENKIETTELDFESAKQLIEDKVKSYEKDYVEAVNSGNYYILEPHLLPEGTMYDQFNKIVNDYYSRNLKLISYNYRIDNIVDLGDGEYKLNIYEEFGVIKDGAETIKKFDSIYTLKIKDGVCYMKDILL